MNLAVTERELMLLKAALSSDVGLARENWSEWAAHQTLEEAPNPELRMLPPVYANLSRIAPELKLPQKLRGKARATFTQNQLLGHGSLSAFAALSPEVAVTLAKGAAFCIQFGAWSWRVMGDVDFHVPREKLDRVAEILPAAGWTLKYGMTWNSLLHRSSLRRNSWNLTKNNADIDLHWRFRVAVAEDWLERKFWSSTRSADFFGQRLLAPSAEFSCVASLRHVLEGHHTDALQTILDTAAWLPLCNSLQLREILEVAQLEHVYEAVADVHGQIGLSAPRLNGRAVRNITPAPQREVEVRLLRNPRLYTMWEKLGRCSKLERLLLRLGGPFSQPLAPTGVPRTDYDLRDCRVIDEIAGPGWGWPEPEHTCFWTDRADNRLLVPLAELEDHVVILSMAAHRSYTPNPTVVAYANGLLIGLLQLSAEQEDYTVQVPRRALFGPWVELAFRPRGYRGHNNSPDYYYQVQRSLPLSRLQIIRGHATTHASRT